MCQIFEPMGIFIITDKETCPKLGLQLKSRLKSIQLDLKAVLIDLTNEAEHKEIIVQKVEYELILECCSHSKVQGHVEYSNLNEEKDRY